MNRRVLVLGGLSLGAVVAGAGVALWRCLLYTSDAADEL